MRIFGDLCSPDAMMAALRPLCSVHVVADKLSKQVMQERLVLAKRIADMGPTELRRNLG